ncbi:hypothetical protein TSAR_009155 [Trichomalopsis sarcophagae]|uniref:Uncharacterized protein n=1 Tax=Trichomalopsis sarcophagae TaxID=543379 RepID=A0A232FDY2_9HYME|nr:hypothetical protein TSAR_009155 [Trichomalopsis sarcophagae]
MLNLEKGNHKQMIRIGLLYIGFSFHLLYNMYPGQKFPFRLVQYFSENKAADKDHNATQHDAMHVDSQDFGRVFKKSISYVTMIGSMR